jgi:hypothetical protein
MAQQHESAHVILLALSPSRLRRSVQLALLVMALAACGCGSRGQPSGRPDLDAIPEIEHRGGATKNTIYEFRAKFKKRGVAAAKQDLPEILEHVQAHEKLKLGEHNATYKELADKFKALETELAGSPSKEAVGKSIDEICTIAAKLPGKANENPVVE